MPSAAARSQETYNHTHWTSPRQVGEGGAGEEQLPPYSPRLKDSSMQANGHYFDQHHPPQYASYDGSGYDSLGSSRTSSAQYGGNNAMQYDHRTDPRANGIYDDSSVEHNPPKMQHPPMFRNGDQYNDFKIDFANEPHINRQSISLNPNLQESDHHDVGKHLLFETALLDTESYEILDIDEIDELKKEHARLNQRIEAANRKLALETKVKNAAQNLQRLYSTRKKDARPDTPQSPESHKRQRSSLLSNRSRTNSGALPMQQAVDEVSQSIKKVDELSEQVRNLLDRRQTVERKLLQHTAAVLAEQASKPPEQRTNAFLHDTRSIDHDGLHLPGPDEFDGIRDILRGKPASSKEDMQKMQEDHAHQLLSMQDRLEQLNSRLRDGIAEASRTRGVDPEPEPELPQSSDPVDQVDNTLSLLEGNMRVFEQNREQNKTHYAQLEDSTNLSRKALEEKLEVLNTQLFGILQSSSPAQATNEMPDPPQVTGQGHQLQLQYLQESMMTLDKVLRQHGEVSRKASAHEQKNGEYESVLSGLWHLVSADGPSGQTPRGSIDESAADAADRSPLSPLKQDFSLPAFSSRVQHLHDVASGAREQQDILRRQIQQQRELNGKSDSEKQAEIDAIQSNYEDLSAAHEDLQDRLAKALANLEEADREASESRGEMANVMDELEQLRKSVEDAQIRQKEVDQRHADVTAEKDAAEQRHADLQAEMDTLQSKLIELTTELTITKADLDGAYGSRKERQKEAGVAAEEMEALQQELTELKKTQEAQRKEHADRAKLLETELQDMTNEFQEMTRESLELEKERGQLESVIDGLREKCDSLEALLGDERMKFAGVVKEGMPKESTSLMVLRQEFKKMMREARTEGVRLLRAEQEERRKLEAEVRKMRQAQNPLGKHTVPNGLQPAHNYSRSTHSRLNSSATSTNGTTGLSNSTLSPSSAATPTSTNVG